MADVRTAELELWLDLVAVQGEGAVQLWLRRGEERDVDRIPAQLRRFLGGGEGHLPPGTRGG